MKVVGLLSGGKDSCFNIIKCIEYGHELVCLANLAPPTDITGEEMNSFMYQTSGTSAIDYQAQCFEVPLIRHIIGGKSLIQSMGYNRTEGDEVEDLYLLLLKVKNLYPDIEGVSCGAILSNYQRNRVENICKRLGLTPISFLWQRNQEQLLDEMISNGVDAILVKVAGVGLDPYKHLGKKLSQMRTLLGTLHGKYGLDICGEGGEYESFVVDCPLFKSFKIVVDEVEYNIDEENSSVGNIVIKKCHLEAKNICDVNLISADHAVVSSFSSIDEKMLSVPSIIKEKALTKDFRITDTRLQSLVSVESPWISHSKEWCCGMNGLLSSCLYYGVDPIEGTNQSVGNIRSQLKSIFEHITEDAKKRGCELSDALFVHIYIENMTDFAVMNEVYSTYFGDFPPSRSCISARLPAGACVAMEVLFCRDSHHKIVSGRYSERRILNVQTLSEWAPMCIGPYCQANQIQESLLWVAGQIPLNPITMKLLEIDRDCSRQQQIIWYLMLSLRHALRISQGFQWSLLDCFSMIIYVNVNHPLCGHDLDPTELSSICQFLLRNNLFESCEKESVNMLKGFSRDVLDVYESEVESDDESLDGINGKSYPANSKLEKGVPILVVFVKDLPRSAPLEVECVFVNPCFRNDVVCGIWRNSSLESSIDTSDLLNPSQIEDQVVVDPNIVSQWPFWQGYVDCEEGLSIDDSPCFESLLMDLVAENKSPVTSDLIEVEVKFQFIDRCLFSSSGTFKFREECEIMDWDFLNGVREVWSEYLAKFSFRCSCISSPAFHSIKIYLGQRIPVNIVTLIERMIVEVSKKYSWIRNSSVVVLSSESVDFEMAWQHYMLETAQIRSSMWIKGL